MDERAMELLKVFDLDKECDYKASNLPIRQAEKAGDRQSAGDRAEASASGRAGSRHEPE